MSPSPWQDLHALRRVVSRPRAAFKYDSWKASLDERSDVVEWRVAEGVTVLRSANHAPAANNNPHALKIAKRCEPCAFMGALFRRMLQSSSWFASCDQPFNPFSSFNDLTW
jgi:hypothetical protein